MSKSEPRRARPSPHERFDIFLLDIGEIVRVPVTMRAEHGVLQHPAEREMGNLMQSQAITFDERL